jgi:hypothetical protein
VRRPWGRLSDGDEFVASGVSRKGHDNTDLGWGGCGWDCRGENRILGAFADGIMGRPQTTFGNVKADVLAHYLPGFQCGDFVEVIQNAGWPG